MMGYTNNASDLKCYQPSVTLSLSSHVAVHWLLNGIESLST